MREPLSVVTKVLPGHRIEITAPDLPVGEEVEVSIQPASPHPTDGRSIIDIIESYDGPRQFKTAEEVDAYLRGERDSWER